MGQKALRKVRNEIGFDNVTVMIPFCRTPEEADRVVAAMECGIDSISLNPDSFAATVKEVARAEQRSSLRRTS